ncbi:origin of replication complex subunit 6 isoform X2 [Ananas comosus]|uniref:Origin of replication complex subunit 6 n=1 Tax=Ananas comosus TaxID=4615 RepID=A0A6P5G6R7_ANACO|nr:origin of replication complex subunit 6 isoform X2 [Ananas comosus]
MSKYHRDLTDPIPFPFPFPFLSSAMDISSIAAKLGLSTSKPLIRKAEELRRLSDVQFDSSIIGVGEVCKAIICLEIAASRFQVIFDRQSAIRLSGMSEKAYMRSFNAMQNGLGVKATLDVRELGIQFGCVRLIPFVQKGLSLYKDRFLAALPASRRASTDFNRPVFTAVAFYLCAKRHKLKVDKFKLIELSGTSETEFTTVSTSMTDLCFDVFGVSKEKKNPKSIKGHRELLDSLPCKRRRDDDEAFSDDSSGDEKNMSCYKKHKKMQKQAYEKWKSSVLSSNNQSRTAPLRPRKQARLSFTKKSSELIAVEDTA